MYLSSRILPYEVGHQDHSLQAMQGRVNKGLQLVTKVVRHLPNSGTSETAVGGPLEAGHTVLFGGTDSTPERSHEPTTASGVALQGRQG